MEVLADKGYYKGPDIPACANAGIKTYLPKPLTSSNKSKGMYTKQDFQYIEADDEY